MEKVRCDTVWPTLGSSTAKEQNRTHSLAIGVRVLGRACALADSDEGGG